VIRPVGDRLWEDINWNGEEHRTSIDTELGTFCRLLYPVMVIVGGRQEAAHVWSHWVLKPNANQGSCQDGVVHMFWVSLVDGHRQDS
jgi:hypothetical protein